MEQDIEKYNVEELEALILDYIKDKKIRHEVLWRRQYLLNKRFDFIQNRKHIERVNNILLLKMNELYDKVKAVKEDLDTQITSGKNVYKDYHLTGEFYFEVNDEDGLSREENLLSKLCDEAKCHWTIENDWGMELHNRTDCFLDTLNWDMEVLNPILEWRLHICYATHAIFVDGDVLSLQDMILLKEEDIHTRVTMSLI